MVRGKLVWVWWVSGSIWPQGTRVMGIFDFNGTSGRGKSLRILHRVDMELSCKLGSPLRGMGSVDSPTHTQKDCVEGDLSTLKLFAQFTVLLL
eukprot:75087-Pelagomonas_calceolata.AAC.1